METIVGLAERTRKDLRRDRLIERFDSWELNEHELGLLEEAYEVHPRRGGRTSREDFAMGYVAALVAHGWAPSFRPESVARRPTG